MGYDQRSNLYNMLKLEGNIFISLRNELFLASHWLGPIKVNNFDGKP